MPADAKDLVYALERNKTNRTGSGWREKERADEVKLAMSQVMKVAEFH